MWLDPNIKSVFNLFVVTWISNNKSKQKASLIKVSNQKIEHRYYLLQFQVEFWRATRMKENGSWLLQNAEKRIFILKMVIFSLVVFVWNFILKKHFNLIFATISIEFKVWKIIFNEILVAVGILTIRLFDRVQTSRFLDFMVNDKLLWNLV